MRAALAGLVSIGLLGAFGCNPPLPPYAVTHLGAPVPPLPASCGDSPACSSTRRWVVFYSEYCASCHRLLRDLSDASSRLSREGICVTTYLVDADGCPEALRISSRAGGWPVAPVEWATVEAWEVDTAPVLYIVDGGQVLARVQGRAPVDDLMRIAADGADRTASGRHDIPFSEPRLN